MFKKFNYNLNHSLVGTIWGISLSIMLACLFELSINLESIIPKSELVVVLLSVAIISNFSIATYILFKSDIVPVNVTYVCPTARKYLSEQEIKEYEKVVEDEIINDIEFGEELVKAYKEI